VLLQVGLQKGPDRIDQETLGNYALLLPRRMEVQEAVKVQSSLVFFIQEADVVYIPVSQEL